MSLNNKILKNMSKSFGDAFIYLIRLNFPITLKSSYQSLHQFIPRQLLAIPTRLTTLLNYASW